jgi:hypothetical protein
MEIATTEGTIEQKDIVGLTARAISQAMNETQMRRTLSAVATTTPAMLMAL